ncbi:MAG: thiamine pyrophosphate-dependent dehydrogenase E1 component subunit alpha [Bdellovibrionales bacterium]|nr:thiamine pyrophosphate-dependent dehydrogenase E1 component subunit alpha [Bdellovibrionales bacterium]
MKKSKNTKAKKSAHPFKDKEFAREFHRLMVRNRVLEEKLIKMSRTGDGFFWIGGPGEEAFAAALGLQVNKGQGPAFDYLHLHYRNNGVLLAMGAPMIDMIRQMRSSYKDPFSGGRNFVSHVARPEWNVVPATSPIETQFSIAPGTGMVQRRERAAGNDAGVTVVIGGDAGTAEGDFATCLVWSSRPKAELPVLMIVTNNGYGISTPGNTQHGERHIADRAKAFRIENNVADGNTPEKCWDAIRDALDYVRSSGKPYLLELKVSRLYGHSSSSGAARADEDCPIDMFEKKLIKQGWLKKDAAQAVWDEAVKEANDALDIVRTEAYPDASTVHDHTFADNGRGGLPGRDC